MNTPVPGIPYRIQSVDYQTYIEIPDLVTTGNNPLYLRPLKDTLRQVWYLEANTNTSSFNIRSAVKDSNIYLGRQGAGICNYGAGPLNIKLTPNDDGSYMLSNDSGFYLLSWHANILSYIQSGWTFDAHKFNFIPAVSAPANPAILPGGYYRIRALGAQLSLTMTPPPSDGSNVHVDVFVDCQHIVNDPGKPDYQKASRAFIFPTFMLMRTSYTIQWLVARKPNGHYTLQNAGRNQYMACEGAKPNLGDLVAGNVAEYEWDLHNIGDFVWSINLPSEKNATPSPLSVGFSDGSANSIDITSLQSTDLAKGQLWFFEKYVALGSDKVEAAREVQAGVYAIHNSDCKGLCITAVSDRGWNIITSSPAYPEDVSKFELAYVGNTAAFTLQYIREDGPTKVPVKYANEMLVADARPSEFILLKGGNDNPGYFISPATLPQKVVTTRFKEDEFSGRTGLAVDSKGDGAASKMWTFQRAVLRS